MIKAVVLAGGSGSRLWPFSRAGRPKQFLALASGDSMLQATMMRLRRLDIESWVTICNEDHRFFVAEQLREINMLDSIILEPESRNTAPAVALAALGAQDDPLLLVLSADNIIKDEAAFARAVRRALPLAKGGKLVTFGVAPNEPHTGYGYIKKGCKCGSGFIVKEFVEKPSLSIASKYLKSGDYLWNSGMFLFRASRYLTELKKFRPDIFKACKSAYSNIKNDLDFLRISEDAFVRCPSESIDYAVMENTSDAAVVPINAGWSDIGSWASLWDLSEKNEDENVILGDVITHRTKNSFVKTDTQLVATIGVDNLVVVATKDTVMVADKNSAQDVKVITEQLRQDNRTEWELSREVYRPWGKYDSIDSADGYQVKRLTVNPGAKLSLQMHHHRSEHWVVVAGAARVHYGEKILNLNVNESTYHGKGVVHALENVGETPLELIEVQVGSYLGEDDIVRFKDDYGRVSEQIKKK